jgi:predicted ATPase/DNA-binding SARP family transcriptional activator
LEDVLVLDLDFRILGPLEVWHDGARLPLSSPSQRTVLAALLVHDNEVVSTDVLTECLWGSAVPDAGRRTLRTYVSKLRTLLDRCVLGAADTVVTEPGGYRIAVNRQQLDAGRFEATWDAARRVAELAPAESVPMLESALALWRGPALAEFRLAEFAQPEIRRLEELRLTVETARIGVLLASGDGTGLAAELEALVAEHPTHERLWAHLMVVLHREGRVREALQAYRRARAALAEAGLSPSEMLSTTQALVLADDPSLRGHVDPGDTGLPAPRTDVVGRDGEIQLAVATLASRRLVTLLGPGGVGKTTVALEVARRVAASGRLVFWLDLAPLGDAEQIASVLAGLAGLPEQPGRPLPDVLRRHLADRPAVLVLDNCEHLLPDVAPFASRLLSACSSLTVLTTSRAALRVSDEHVLPVSPLVVPEHVDASSIAGSAVELLERRVRDLGGVPALAAADRLAFVRICRALDGLPLAIELAVPRLRVMAAEGLADLLDERLRPLVSDRRDVVDRHSSLDATLRWSYELLDQRERLLLDRLSVFSGAFGLDAAQRVCGFGELEAEEVIDVLAELVSKSLVVHVVGTDRGAFRLLETIREWARRRLDERQESDLLADRLAEHCLAVLDELPDRPEAIAALTAIAPDAVQSIDHLIRTAQYDAAATLWESSHSCFMSTGRSRECSLYAALLLPHLDQMEPLSRAEVLNISGLDALPPDPERSRRMLQRAVEEFRSADRSPCDAHNALGIAHLQWGEWSDGAAQFERAIAEDLEKGSVGPIWILRSNLALALARLDRFEEANEQLALGVAEAARHGWTETPGVAIVQASIAYRSGDLHGARAVLLARAETLDMTNGEGTLDDAWVHCDLACLELELGDLAAARDHVVRSLRVFTTTQLGVPTCKALAVASAVAERVGRWELAATIQGGVRSWMDAASYVIDPEWLEHVIDRSRAADRNRLEPLRFASMWANGVGRHPLELAEVFLDEQTAPPMVRR